jgi:predicted ATPase
MSSKSLAEFIYAGLQQQVARDYRRDLPFFDQGAIDELIDAWMSRKSLAEFIYAGLQQQVARDYRRDLPFFDQGAIEKLIDAWKLIQEEE